MECALNKEQVCGSFGGAIKTATLLVQLWGTFHDSRTKTTSTVTDVIKQTSQNQTPLWENYAVC